MSYRAKHIFQLILLSLLSLQFIFLGYTKFSGHFCQLYMVSGMDGNYLTLLGVVEVFGALTLFIASFRMLSCLVLSCITVGYGVASFQFNQPLLLMTVIATVGLLAMVGWLEYDKSLAGEELKKSTQPY